MSAENIVSQLHVVETDPRSSHSLFVTAKRLVSARDGFRVQSGGRHLRRDGVVKFNEL